MWQGITSYLKANVWSAPSILVSGYFFWAFHLHVGFPPTIPLTSTSTTYLGLFTFFAVLPFAQRLKIWKIFEFEKVVEQVREEVKEVRDETGELTTSVSVVADTISLTENQPVMISTEEEEVVREGLSEALPLPEPTKQRQDIQEYLEAGDPNVTYALGRLRMDLERELRRILNEPAVAADDPLRKRGRAARLTVRLLFRQLGSINSRYRNMQRSFDCVIEVCNGAVRAGQIPEHIAHEVIDMGVRILGELKKESEDPITKSPAQNKLSDFGRL